MQKGINLSHVKADTEIKDSYRVIGTLDGEKQPYKISIADDATVTLDGVTISGVKSQKWAGLTCSGDATIILADGSTNTLTMHNESANTGIAIGGEGTTLTIDTETAGTGTLTAQGGINATGIGTNINTSGGKVAIMAATTIRKSFFILLFILVSFTC